MTLQSTYFLVAHGSRDPRPQVALENLGRLLYSRLVSLATPAASTPACSEQSTSPLVGTGVLELGPSSLDEQIKQFAQDTLSAGLGQIQLFPLFLLPGVHVMEDIPAAAMTAQRSLGEKIHIDLRPHLGVHQGLIRLLIDQMTALPVEAWILLAHGSHRQGGNEPIEAMARSLIRQFATHPTPLSVVPAYWLVSPSLESQVIKLVGLGYKQIGILPYFLFPGSTTDVIIQKIACLRDQFPQVELRLADPLKPNARLVDLILDLVQLP